MEVNIDIERLREDVINFFEGLFLAAGFGGAMIEMEEAKRATPEKLIDIAIRNGFDLNNYIINKTL